MEMRLVIDELQVLILVLMMRLFIDFVLWKIVSVVVIMVDVRSFLEMIIPD